MTSSAFHAPISEEIWGKKYRFLDKFTGKVFDQTVEDTWMRIARALAEPEKDKDRWSAEFYQALEGFKFLPAGRIIAGAGTSRRVTLFNCYVMGTIPDSMDGIFSSLREAALTMQQGGGIGYDFSTLRPKGAQVKKVAADASGPLTFMDVWDSMCRTVMSAGSRRGAMMATMRCDHPDIEDFITAKNDPARLRMFNMSVLVTDAFMAAVKHNEDWALVFNKKIYKVVKARDLWDRIMRSTYDYAEPGVIFIDRINKDNNLSYMETISATNPCGEQPLPPYGACLLGSINLAALVENAYADRAGIDSEALKGLVRIAVRMMDNVNDVSLFPLDEQLAEALAKRRIGLGITGLADALLMCGLRYGSDEAAKRAQKWMKLIALTAYETGIELAKEKGPFPALDRAAYVNGDHFASRVLPDYMKSDIITHGIRNSHYLSIAPTGTISLYAGNISSGVEPIFAPSYTRKTLQDDGTRKEQRVVDYAVAQWEKRLKTGVEPQNDLPPAYVDAQTLTPAEHVKMQAAIQPYIDTSISKTVNIPADADFDTFKAVYQMAYDEGCKGCTTYRPNDVTGSVIEIEKPKAESETPKLMTEEESTHVAEMDFGEIEKRVLASMFSEDPMPRPEKLDGTTYKVKLNDSSLYVTITDIDGPGGKRPFEVFIISQNPEHQEWTTALTRMISAIMRRPHSSRFVPDELKAVFSAKGGGFWKGRYWPSTVAVIGEVIEQHMRAIGYPAGGPMSPTGRAPSKPEEQRVPRRDTQMVPPIEILKATCPKCHSTKLKNESGCLTCLDCGHSKCG